MAKAQNCRCVQVKSDKTSTPPSVSKNRQCSTSELGVGSCEPKFHCRTRGWFLRMTVGSPVPRKKFFVARCAAACAPSRFPHLATLTNEHQRTESPLTGL